MGTYRKIWTGHLSSFGGYRWTRERGPHLGITVQVDDPVTQEGRMVDVPMTPELARQAIASLTRALAVYEEEAKRYE